MKKRPSSDIKRDAEIVFQKVSVDNSNEPLVAMMGLLIESLCNIGDELGKEEIISGPRLRAGEPLPVGEFVKIVGDEVYSDQKK